MAVQPVQSAVDSRTVLWLSASIRASTVDPASENTQHLAVEASGGTMAGGGQRTGGEEQKQDRRLRWGDMSRQGGASWGMESLGKIGELQH